MFLAAALARGLSLLVAPSRRHRSVLPRKRGACADLLNEVLLGGHHSLAQHSRLF